MKRLKICIFVILTILTINISYPQAMLKTICITEDNSNIEIVDKVYKYKNNYLDSCTNMTERLEIDVCR